MAQVAVIGLGRFGSAFAEEATAIGHEVLGIDKNEKRVEELKDHMTHTVRADAMEQQVLERLGLRSFHTALVAVGSNELANIMVTMNLINMGVRNVVSRARSEVHAAILQKLGVSRVVFPETDTGVRTAHTFGAPHVMEYLDLTRSHGVSKMQVPPTLIGQTLLDSKLSSRYELSTLLLVRGNEIMVNPNGFTLLKAGDILVVVGEDSKLEQVRRL